jgi:hypothetical protein
MTDAVLKPPMHLGKQVECFENMSKNDYYQTSRAKQLEERAHTFFSGKQDYRARKQYARWH